MRIKKKRQLISFIQSDARLFNYLPKIHQEKWKKYFFTHWKKRIFIWFTCQWRITQVLMTYDDYFLDRLKRTCSPYWLFVWVCKILKRECTLKLYTQSGQRWIYCRKSPHEIDLSTKFRLYFFPYFLISWKKFVHDFLLKHFMIKKLFDIFLLQWYLFLAYNVIILMQY